MRSVLAVREVVTKALEDARNDKVDRKEPGGAVNVTAPAAVVEALADRGRRR